MSQLAYDQKDAARQLGVCVNTFVEHVRPHIKSVVVGGARRFPASELQRWLDREARSL